MLCCLSSLFHLNFFHTPNSRMWTTVACSIVSSIAADSANQHKKVKQTTKFGLGKYADYLRGPLLRDYAFVPFAFIALLMGCHTLAAHKMYRTRVHSLQDDGRARLEGLKRTGKDRHQRPGDAKRDQNVLNIWSYAASEHWAIYSVKYCTKGKGYFGI